MWTQTFSNVRIAGSGDIQYLLVTHIVPNARNTIVPIKSNTIEI